MSDVNTVFFFWVWSCAVFVEDFDQEPLTI